MLFDLIMVIIVIRYLKRNLSPEELTAEWNRNLTAIMFVSIGLFVGDTLFDQIEWLMELASLAVIGLLTWIIYIRKEWKKMRSVLNAMLPLVFIKTVSYVADNLFHSFYEKYDNYFDTAIVFGLIWLAAMIAVGNKQRKALEKERLKIEEKDREIRITEKLKATLEIQVQERTAELVKQKEALQQTVNELKTTQAQLVQSEKMASLGELTAGIAHEIQNPLNFVNNFAEVNTELIAEMQEELDKGNMDEVRAIIADIASNEQKINLHGKRADAIVKGMLQHSRSSNNAVKEPTDINGLADEYLRLAYHGLRAKDKSFNATMKTNYDDTIGKINIIPQDIGRVILNLITNAFYAVAERKKQLGDKFEPVVTVTTKIIRSAAGNTVSITVKDNGNGVPAKAMDKIFQPFFTTKPTGQGTGLGLSMSYEIVTKGHGGELKVVNHESKGVVDEESGAEFSIILPV